MRDKFNGETGLTDTSNINLIESKYLIKLISFERKNLQLNKLHHSFVSFLLIYLYSKFRFQMETTKLITSGYAKDAKMIRKIET